MENLDLLFINPSLDWHRQQEELLARRINKDIPNQEMPHIGIAYLLAVAKQNGIRAKYLDMAAHGFSLEDVVDFVAKSHPSLVGFTAFTQQIRSTGVMARRLKREFPNLKICVGGPHVSAIPSQTLEEFPSVDFVVLGEGERVLVKIVDAIHKQIDLSQIRGLLTRGAAKCNSSWEPIKELDDLPFPAWEEFTLSKYGGVYPHRTALELPMVTGRGCPFKCVFCCRSLGHRVRRRSVQNVIAEIQRNNEKFGCESIAFVDETFILGRTWAEQFFAAMIGSGLNKKITWSCSTRVNNMSPELLRKMKNAGCYYVFYGLESADEKILSVIKKGTTVTQMKDAVRWAKDEGIVPVGAFIVGLPGETKETVIKAIHLARELDCFSVTFPIAVPFPGTELRSMALKGEYGMRIVSNNWDHFAKQGPGVMESDELSWETRKKLQQLAYAVNPKKDYDQYVRSLEKSLER